MLFSFRKPNIVKPFFCFLAVSLLFIFAKPTPVQAIYLVPGDNPVSSEDLSTAATALTQIQWDVSATVYDNKVRLVLPNFDGYVWTIRKDKGQYVGIGLDWEQVYDGQGGISLDMDVTNPKGVGFYILLSNDSTSTVIVEESYIYFPNNGVNYIAPENRIAVSTDGHGNITDYLDISNNLLSQSDSRIDDYRQFNPLPLQSPIASPSDNVTYAGGGSSQDSDQSTRLTPKMEFKDLNVSNWAYQQIYRLTSLGYIKGYPDGTFRPEGKISRAEFSIILGRLLTDKWPSGKRNNAPQSFEDLNSSHWAGGPINELMGYMINTDAGEIFGRRFNPDKRITREEVVAVVYAVLKGTGSSALDNQNSFSDLGKSRFADSVNFCVDHGFITGYPDKTFRPYGDITRAEASVILTRLVEKAKLEG